MKELLEKLKTNRTPELPSMAMVLADMAGTEEACEVFTFVEKMAQDMGLSEKRTNFLKQTASRMVCAIAVGELIKAHAKANGIHDEKVEEGIDSFYGMSAHEDMRSWLKGLLLTGIVLM